MTLISLVSAVAAAQRVEDEPIGAAVTAEAPENAAPAAMPLEPAVNQTGIPAPERKTGAASEPSAVPAESEAQPAAPGAEEAADPEIETIIVTAGRRLQSLNDVPFSVSVVGGQQISEMGAKGVQDYAGTVPGLSLQSTSGYNSKYTIRGISTDGQVSELHPLTAVYFDDSPVTYGAGYSSVAYSPDPQLVDINRIEVLRGPQGTLFGAHAMGGAVRIIPNAPDPTHVDGFYEANAGGIYGGGLNGGADGAYNLPVGDGQGAIRAVGYVQHTGGWIDNLDGNRDNVNSNQVQGGRLSGRWDFNESWQLDSKVVFQKDHRGGNLWGDERLQQDQQYRPYAEPSNDRWMLYNSELNYTGDGYKIVSSTSYLQRNSNFILDVTDLVSFLFDLDPAVPSYFYGDDHYGDLTQEVRIQSENDGPLQWLGGAFFQRQRYRYFQTNPSPGLDVATSDAAAQAGAPDSLGVLHYNDTLNQSAAFIDLTWSFAEHWKAGLGDRVFRIDQDIDANSDGLLFGNTNVPAAGARDQGQTPRVSLQYEPLGPASFYANAAKGFRPGGANPPTAAVVESCSDSLTQLGLDQAPKTFKADSLWSYELGTRTHWFGQRLRWDAAAYHIDWSHFQASVTPANCGINFFIDAGRIRSDGIETEVTAQLTPQLELESGGNLSDGHYGQDVPYIGAQKGDRLLGVPRYTYNVALTYRLQHPGSYWRLDWKYQDGYYNFQYQRDIAGFGVLNAAFVWTIASVQLRAQVSNLLNDRGTIDVFHPTPTYNWDFLEQPRTFSLGFLVPFG